MNTQPAHVSTLPHAAVVWDMAAAGIHAEVSETPFPWFATAAPAVSAQSPSKPTQPPAQPFVFQPKPTATKAPVPLKQLGPQPLTPATVWTVGQGGGLIIALRSHTRHQGTMPLSAEERTLLTNMLKAVGEGEPTGWLVLGSDADQPRTEMQPALQTALNTLNPTHILILGGPMLGSLTASTVSVDMWQKTPTLPNIQAPVGATFPLEMLLAQPMFKRMAWQHLLAWKTRWENPHS